MNLSLSQKQTFYHELGQFARSGIPIPQAIEALVPETRGNVRGVFQKLLHLLLGGKTVGDAFAALPATFSALELSMIEASSGSGRLEQAFTYLSNYFASLETLRAGVVKRTMWPLVQLHLGVLIVNLGSLFLGTLTFSGFLLRCASTLAVFYLAGFIVWVLVAALLRLARVNAGLDRALGLVPALGKLRRYLALSRFCATYEMQLQAGINVMDAVGAAGDSSQSAYIQSTVARLVPKLRGGTSLGVLLTGEAAFPAALQRSVRLGEESGSLDEDLIRWAGYYQKTAVDLLETLGGWISRLVYLVVAGYFIYAIIGSEAKQLNSVDQMLKE